MRHNYSVRSPFDEPVEQSFRLQTGRVYTSSAVRRSCVATSAAVLTRVLTGDAQRQIFTETANNSQRKSLFPIVTDCRSAVSASNNYQKLYDSKNELYRTAQLVRMCLWS